MFHSFSLLKSTSDTDGRLFSVGKHNYFGGDNSKVEKLRGLLSFISLSPDFETATFSELTDDLMESDNSIDGYVYVQSEEACKTANILNYFNHYSYSQGRVIDELKENRDIYFENKKIIAHPKNKKGICPYAYYVYNEKDEVVFKSWNDNGEFEYEIGSPGTYRIKFYIKHKNGIFSQFLHPITITDEMMTR